MFKSLWETIEPEVSGTTATRWVSDIARHHRIQASPGFRRAAEWILEQLLQAGLDARILTYPADQSASFWSASSFQEWDAQEGTLHLLEPSAQAGKLGDYREIPLSLVVRSLSYEGEAEVVVMDKGDDPAEYEGLDVRGKIVLARGQVQRVHDLAIARRGAVGLLYDGMTEVEPVRPAWSLPDAIQYTSFWWLGQPPQGFGFALTPRQGDRLRRLAQKQTLRVRAKVEASLYDGTMEVVEATIPGTTDEEIVLVAHLCHPQPSANDNGSGAAALIEVARALSALVARGELAQPRRTIRFLWLPEMTGSYAYLAAHEDRIPQMVAGLNLDMVGQDQEQCGSALLFEQAPDAFANFASTLLTRLREDFLPDVKSHSGMGGYPLFRYADVPFSGGSDHYIFSDPTVGVPMPMIIQWPDRFYHTTADTPDRVDPQMMGRVGRLSATYAYWLAQAGVAEARWLTREVSARFRQQIIGTVQAAVTRADDQEMRAGREKLQRALNYQVTRQLRILASVRRLASVDVAALQKEDAAFAKAELARVADLLPSLPLAEVSSVEGGEGTPIRRFRGPLSSAAAIARMDEVGRDRWWALQQRIGKLSRTLPVLAVYWADGKRSIAEIAALVGQETGQTDAALFTEYFSGLADLGLVDVR